MPPTSPFNVVEVDRFHSTWLFFGPANFLNWLEQKISDAVLPYTVIWIQEG